MKRYRVWIYTKHGAKKRYETDTCALLNADSGNLVGKCLVSGVNFAIPLANVDVYEWVEVTDGSGSKD